MNACTNQKAHVETTGTPPRLADVGGQHVLVQKLLSKHGATSDETSVSLSASHTKGITALRESLPLPPAKPGSAQRSISRSYTAACLPSPLSYTLPFEMKTLLSYSGLGATLLSL